MFLLQTSHRALMRQPDLHRGALFSARSPQCFLCLFTTERLVGEFFWSLRKCSKTIFPHGFDLLVIRGQDVEKLDEQEKIPRRKLNRYNGDGLPKDSR